MEEESKVRVLLVDDQFIVRQTLRCILQPYRDIEVVGEASDGQEAVASVGMFQPAVIQAGALEVLQKEDAMKNLYVAIQRAIPSISPNAH